MKRIKLILLGFLFFYSTQILAVTGTGCLLDGTNTIYTNYTCTIGLLGICLIKYYPTTDNPQPYTTNMNCFSYVTTGGTCGTDILKGALLKNGTEVNYNNSFPCPIDDYAWALFTAAGTFGAWMIRKKQLLV